ncbi:MULTISPECIES: hypothetical protein [Cysteiniphilum]|uniref:hypothetical protein n=1 Tax=Cysteiniphilum TaxID=2056696 RepID=UPI0017832BC6|nr:MULTISPECIES: hypothetical protein [Cysteiniphilum]
MSKTKIDLSDLELEFIANAALAFDGMIADEQADLSHIAEIARFLVGLYGKGADLSEDEKKVLRVAYRVLG